MISAGRMAAVDANAAALGIPRKQLMESSGNAVATAVKDHAEPGSRVVLCCGRGNNGGDAFVAARFLSAYDTETVLLGRPELIGTDIARENWEALDRAELSTRTIRDSTAIDSLALDDADVIVDAILGTGVAGELREPEASAVSAVNAAEATVVSVDVPTGLDPDTGETAGRAVDADAVVTFHDMKPGLTSIAADVTVADIGIPAAAETFVGPGDIQREARRSHSHKGDHGTVAVVGGGPYTGAPALTAQAALRAGADLAYLVVPSAIEDTIQGFSENLIVRSYPGDHLTPTALETVRSTAKTADVTVIGPGLGARDTTLAAVRSFLASHSGRAVVDADALAVIADLDTDSELVCTPHAGEFQKMGGDDPGDTWRSRRDAAVDLAGELTDRGLDATILLKGAYDIVSDGETTRVNRTGNPSMTVGGTGDVLAGVSASIFCLEPAVEASSIAAYVNGRAGDLVVDDRGSGLVATDLIDRVPDAFRTDE